MIPEQFKDLLYVKDDNGIVTLTINAPERKNAMSLASFLEVYFAVDIFENDETAHAMIITGAVNSNSTDDQQAFSSGAYFHPKAFEGVSEEIMSQLDPKDIAQKRTTLKMFQCEKPIIAAINGLVIGGAFTMMLAGADQIYMSEHAWIQLPFAKLGICAELGSSFLLPRLLGMQRAKEILFYGDRIDAKAALDLHIANAVLPHDELLAYAYEKTKALVPPHGAGLSIRTMKKILHAPLLDDVTQALDRENEALRMLMKSADFAEGIGARSEKRQPVFKGA